MRWPTMLLVLGSVEHVNVATPRYGRARLSDTPTLGVRGRFGRDTALTVSRLRIGIFRVVRNALTE